MKEKKLKKQQDSPRSAEELQVDRGRLDFLKKLGGGIFASMVLPAVMSDKFELSAKEAAEVNIAEMPDLPAPSHDEDPIIRMMRDLKRALQKPLEERSWAMVLDLRKCVGCHACTTSCIAENKLGPGLVYRPVMEEEIGEYPNVRERFTPRPCMQCENPPCTGVCPVHATWLRKDGIVEIDYEQCIGCRYCITACPYGARVFDSGFFYNEDNPNNEIYLSKDRAIQYEKAPAYDYGEEWVRKGHESPVGNARKCHFCLHRIEKGLLPECVVTCIGRATFFGDQNDPESLVSELRGLPNVMVLKEEMGTKPKVYYLL